MRPIAEIEADLAAAEAAGEAVFRKLLDRFDDPPSREFLQGVAAEAAAWKRIEMLEAELRKAQEAQR